MKKTWFLFGEAAINKFEEEGVESLVSEHFSDSLGLFCFTEGVTTPSELLDAVDGFMATRAIDEEDFNSLREYYILSDLTPETNEKQSVLMHKKEVLSFIIEVREDLINRDKVSREGEQGKACTLLRDWMHGIREEINMPWSELDEMVLNHFGMDLEYIYPNASESPWKREGNYIFDSEDRIVFSLTRKGDTKNPPLSSDFLAEIIYKHNFEGISFYEIEDMLNKKSKDYSAKIIEDAIEQFNNHHNWMITLKGVEKFS